MNAEIVLIPGDGIGPEIIEEAKRVLQHIGDLYGHHFLFRSIDLGGISIDRHGTPLTDEALKTAASADAVLLGAVGGDLNRSGWYDAAPHLRPEAGLLKLRKELGLFANLRPALLYPELQSACPLRQDLIEGGFDLYIVRELTGGLYFGERYTKEEEGKRFALDTLYYHEDEIRRVAIKGFEAAMNRKKNLVSVDKANVLDTSRLWRSVVEEVAKDYPQVKLSHMLVDNCAMQLVMNPGQFDVILTENMFGDILSDEASMITGSIGMLPSASLRQDRLGLYEPSHGAAPDIAGKGIANPLATILSAGMLLGYSLGLRKEQLVLESAVKECLKKGYRTPDIYRDGTIKTDTRGMAEAVIKEIASPRRS